MQSSNVASTVELPEQLVSFTEPDLKNLGWNTDPTRLPKPLVHHLENGQLFTLIRRFNKRVFHVKAITSSPSEELDLEVSDQEEFSPDKLRANLERLYITVIVGLAGFGKHLARLRSWNEPRRTALFCIAYFFAWHHNLLLFLLCSVLFTLVLVPPSRALLFPPAPLAAISSASGNLQVPRAGQLGSGDSLSGAPQRHAGEAVEMEASNFVAGVASIAVGTATGQGAADVSPAVRTGGESTDADTDGEAPETDVLSKRIPDPTAITAGAKDARSLSSGTEPHPDVDPAKKHVQAAMWEKARPFMRVLEDIADTWERFGNALHPTPPFSQSIRLRLAAPLIPAMLGSVVIPMTVFVKTAGFALGIALFADPLLSKGAHSLTRRFPRWREWLDLKRTLLRGVPTNAQLALTLLRLAEAANAPLPPPPPPGAPLEDEENPKGLDAIKEHDFQFDTEGYEVEGVEEDDDDAMEEQMPGAVKEVKSDDIGGTDTEQASDPKEEGSENGDADKKKHGSKIAGMLKKTAKASVGGALGVDHLKAKLGSEPAKRRLGVLSDETAIPGQAEIPHDTNTENDRPKKMTRQEKKERERRAREAEGPTVFSARYRGKAGSVVLVTSPHSGTPCVSFVRGSVDIEPSSGGLKDDLQAVWTVPLASIHELKKVGGLGWTGRMVVGWALGKAVMDGLEISTKEGSSEEGEGKWLVTAVRGREELFNRLVAAGNQQWEML